MSQCIDNLISIGSACRTRYQIDLFHKKRLSNYKPTSYFFDYLMMGGVAGVLSHINRDLKLMDGDIIVGERNGRFLPMDKNSGMFFLHDFGSSNSWWSSYDECASAIESNLHESLNKFNYLGEKTSNALRNGGCIALIFHGVATQKSFDALSEAVRSRFTNDFILVNILEESELDNRCAAVLTLTVNDADSPKKGKPTEWQGCDKSWYEALSQLNLSPCV